MMNTLMTAVNFFPFLSTYTLAGRTVVVVRDFLGFDEDFNEVMNPDINWNVVADVRELCDILGVEVEFTSEDI